MKKFFLPFLALFSLCLLGSVAIIWGLNARSSMVREGAIERPHYHAGFQVYYEDKLLDFSGFEYMELAPCGPGDLHADDTVHLHNGVGDVIHVHASGMTWQNVADYLNERSGRDFTNEQLSDFGIRAYLNGVLVYDLALEAIKSYDSVVVLVGKNTEIEQKLQAAVTLEHIKKIEADKENCGS